MRSVCGGYKLKSDSLTCLEGFQTRSGLDPLHLPLPFSTHRDPQHVPALRVLPQKFGREHIGANRQRHEPDGINNLASHSLHALCHQKTNYQGVCRGRYRWRAYAPALSIHPRTHRPQGLGDRYGSR